ncbi:hypothetical protein BDZ45DRAFT_749164 [Acephala macrosclerotiorum]|nr:hypothetical protein BDZ45DRAFT_749164 [Acephala macrosclerotiorum]
MAKPKTLKQFSTSKKKTSCKLQASSRPRSPPQTDRAPPKQPQVNDAVTRLTSFTLFEKLIPELRVRIWKKAIPEPETKQFYIKFRGPINGGAVIRFQATRKQTAFGLQFACHESRHEVLKALPHRLLSIGRNQEYRFGDLDAICIINGHEMVDMYQYILPADANGMRLGAWAGKINTLRLSSRALYWYNDNEYQAVARMLAEFRQLSELNIVMAYRDLLLDVDVNAAVAKGIKNFGGSTRPRKQALRSVVKSMNRTVLKLQLVSQFPRVPLTLLAPEDWTSEVKKYWQPRD